jgi:competence protein ComEA
MDFSLSSLQARALTVVMVVVVGAICGMWWLGSPAPISPDGLGQESDYRERSPQTAESLAPTGMVVIVDVAGKVRNPGVVQLPAGSRVLDAINAAGGLKPGVAAGINMARILNDGEQLLVGVAPANSSTTSGVMNLNSATESELEELPGVGPVLAQRIVDYRDANGPFTTLDELDQVSGVGPAMMENLRDLVSLG